MAKYIIVKWYSDGSSVSAEIAATIEGAFEEAVEAGQNGQRLIVFEVEGEIKTLYSDDPGLTNRT